MNSISNGGDVVAYLKEQHSQIKALFSQTVEASGKEREESFAQLRRLLAVHETAEEEIVHPAARQTLPDGENVVEARLAEEHEAKEMLAALEKLDVDSEEFEEMLSELEESVVLHAEAEETEEFEGLGERLEPARLERMKKAAEFAESVAPTRPHPGVESAVANLLVGPFASMLDRTRDAFAGKS
jgi:hypothetical protein